MTTTARTAPEPDSDAARKSLRWAIAAGLLALVLLLAVHFGEPVSSGLWFRTFFDALHVPVFGLVALCLFVMTGHFGPQRLGRRVAVAAAGALALSLLSEAAQIPGSRDASVDDLVSDWLGAGGALLLAVAAAGNIALLRLRAVCALAGLGMLAAALLPFFLVSAAYLERNAQFPVLLTFESRFNHVFVRAQNATLGYTHSDTHGRTAARVRLGSAPWPGLIVHDIAPDWSEYRELVVAIGTPDDTPLELNLRVHDSAHRLHEQTYSDRFNTSLEITPETRTLRIPLSSIAAAPATRTMDLGSIDGVVIFGTADMAGREFYLASLRLE